VRLLLDTRTFLWLNGGDATLSARARRAIEDARNESHLSVASIWEMAIKVSLRKLELDDPLDVVVEQGTNGAGVALLGISKVHALRVATLPWHHRDPFDRLLAAQALDEDIGLVTRDTAFDAHGVRRMW